MGLENDENGDKEVVKTFVTQMAKNLAECIDKSIQKCIGETNLYKMDMWKDAGKYCKHGNNVFCDSCRRELENENHKEKI